MPTLPTHLRIATRESRLALAQTQMVADALRARYPGLNVELVGMTTRGDTILDRPLAKVGGKGLFIKELEVALAEDRAEIAVHSMKDVPMELAGDFALTTFGTREDPRDAFVSARFEAIEALPAGSVVGTSSLRRECQLRSAFPRLEFRPLRGNVNTRLAKLDAGDYDAIILAAAGLRRLAFESRIRAYLPPALAIPAIGQGILGIEYLAGRDDIAALLRPFRDPATKHAARAERAFGLVAEGSCEVPVGALAHVSAGQLSLEAFIGLPDGTRVVRDAVRGEVSQDEALGRALGEKLLAMGGREILATLQRANA